MNPVLEALIKANYNIEQILDIFPTIFSLAVWFPSIPTFFLFQTRLAFQALVTAVLLERPDDPSFFMLRQ